MKKNKVFKIELCQEDAQRIILALDSYKQQYNKVIEQCDTEDQRSVAWLEWSYISELAYMMEDVLDVNRWWNVHSVQCYEMNINVQKNIDEFSTGFVNSVEKVWMICIIYCIVGKCVQLLWSWPPVYHKSSQMSIPPGQWILWHSIKVFHRQWVIFCENTVPVSVYTNRQWICLWKTIRKLWKTCGKSITNLWKTVYKTVSVCVGLKVFYWQTSRLYHLTDLWGYVIVNWQYLWGFVLLWGCNANFTDSPNLQTFEKAR